MRHHLTRPAREPLLCRSGSRKKQAKPPIAKNDAPVEKGMFSGRTNGPMAKAAAEKPTQRGTARFQGSFNGRKAQAASCGMRAREVSVRSTMRTMSQETRV